MFSLSSNETGCAPWRIRGGLARFFQLTFFGVCLGFELVTSRRRRLAAIEMAFGKVIDQPVGNFSGPFGSGCSTLTSTSRLKRMGTMLMSSARARMGSAFLP